MTVNPSYTPSPDLTPVIDALTAHDRRVLAINTALTEEAQSMLRVFSAELFVADVRSHLVRLAEGGYNHE